ncbi:MAG: hypothetical protein JWP20_1064 [Roseomonas sp.]|nr:hypothetical protein [Roseomonas sp.]
MLAEASPSASLRPAAAARGVATPAQAPRQAQERAVVVANELGLALRELYVVPTGSLDTAPDRLGMDTLPSGASLRVPLGRQTLCLFDVRVVLSDGSAQEKRGVDLCRVARVTFGDPTAPLREATIENATDLTMRELYAAPSPAARRGDGRNGAGQDGAERGPDRLGSDVVAPDSSFTLRLGRTRDCVYDVTAIFEDDTVEERLRVNLCRRARLSFGDPSVPRRDLEVANGSGRAMRSLYAVTQPAAPGVPPGQDRPADRWGIDRLGAVPVEAGDTFRLRLRSRACQADLRAVYDDETAEEKRGVDICGADARALFDGSGIPRQPERAFTLINRHGAAVEEAYASAIDETDWGEDKLSGTALDRGGRHEVTLHGGCEVDLRIVFANGGAEERRGVDICATSLIVLRPGWTLAEKLDQNPGAIEPGPPREGSVRLRNAGRSPIVELYVQDQGAPRGTDRLGATVLGRGETLDFQPPEGVGCTATLSAVFRDGQEIVLPGFNLCSGTEVTLP